MEEDGGIQMFFQKKSQKEMKLFRPEFTEEFREIVDKVEAGNAVCVDLSNMDIDQAMRVLDLLTGACYAMKGSIRKVSQSAYIITPKGMTWEEISN